MKNKIQIKKENNSLDLSNYEPLRDELSKILENQKIRRLHLCRKREAVF